MKPSQRFRKPHRIKKKTSIFKNKLFWLGILTLVFIGTILYFLIFSSFFQIKEIEIYGNEKVPAEELQKEIGLLILKKFWKISSRSIFLASLNKIKENLFEKFPQIANLNLKRKFPNFLILEIEERKPEAVWCSNSFCFFIDEEGIIFEEISEIPLNYLKIKELREKKLELGEKVLEKEILDSIKTIETKFKENLKIDIEEFIIASEERLNVKTFEGWEIYFNLKEDINWQITKLGLVLEKEIPLEKRGNLEYIDLRFDRVYYKYR